MGNSEVGHLNLGAGRVVPQDLVRISQILIEWRLLRHPAAGAAMRRAAPVRGHPASRRSPGSGGVQRPRPPSPSLRGAPGSSRQANCHSWVSGWEIRPYARRGGGPYPADGHAGIAGSKVDIATLTGRDYGRTGPAVGAHQAGPMMPGGVVWEARCEHPCLQFSPPTSGARRTSSIQPPVDVRKGRPVGTMRDGDGVFCFNIAATGCVRSWQPSALEGFDGFDVSDRPALAIVTMTQYDQTFAIPRPSRPSAWRAFWPKSSSGRGAPSCAPRRPRSTPT